jgi:hypothetical protein
VTCVDYDPASAHPFSHIAQERQLLSLLRDHLTQLTSDLAPAQREHVRIAFCTLKNAMLTHLFQVRQNLQTIEERLRYLATQARETITWHTIPTINEYQ